ncbi:hypothetical protein [Croceicoccus pelagius]|uniref:hypothetical protein n=1 Tax=Croceicoccus pelagius TaxID=1703341 RepID=UPI000A8B29B6|nr:hypothetical protein [Croceicoccus pelagius]
MKPITPTRRPSVYAKLLSLCDQVCRFMSGCSLGESRPPLDADYGPEMVNNQEKMAEFLGFRAEKNGPKPDLLEL